MTIDTHMKGTNVSYTLIITPSLGKDPTKMTAWLWAGPSIAVKTAHDESSCSIYCDIDDFGQIIVNGDGEPLCVVYEGITHVILGKFDVDYVELKGYEK